MVKRNQKKDQDSIHASIYSQAELYDIAFSFKEYAAECEFMLTQFKRLSGREASSWLELAAGPARHTLEFSRRGLSAQALDISQEMVNYGLSLAKESQLAIDYAQGDMTNFTLNEKVDLAGLLIDSISYILDADTLQNHFRCVADALNDDGLYAIEMAHPKDVFGVDHTTKTEWEITRDGIAVHTQWGDDSDIFDPITQITDVTVRVSAQREEDHTEFVDHAKQRRFTATEFQALIRASDCFELVAQFGAMDPEIALSDKKAWRMISLLRKKPK